MQQGMNVFVKIDEYKDILDIMELISEKVKEAKTIMGKINDLKNQEDAELELWKSGLDDVERKLGFIDQTLFEPKY
jgi:tetrahydromethanopterin S-methyltransferase subunit G